MRVLQLIDSLRPGGAEKMAINIANALLPHVDGSYLCCTRQEGMLKKQIKLGVGYLLLNKKSSLDPRAIFRLRKYIHENKIDIVHAHSTSYFLAVLVRLSGGKFKLIWHDHYGESEFLEKREFKVLKKFSRLFAGIISVNTELQNWAIEKLDCKKVIELKNFIPESDPSKTSNTKLKGDHSDFKIICVANLRPQKDHLNLLKAFELLEPYLNVSLHLVGEDPKTEYSASILKKLEGSPIKHKIFYYGTQPDIITLLRQADMGVLSSKSEGLPLALLEYGMAGLPVVCTNVGHCEKVVGKNGRLVKKGNPHQFFRQLLSYINNREEMEKFAVNMKENVIRNFSEKEIINRLLEFYKYAK